MTPQELLDKIEQYANAVAEAEGQNLEYCPSVDFSYLPDVVACALDKEDFLKYVTDIYQDIFDWEDGYEESLHFLARNNRVLPDELASSTFAEISEYVKDNWDRISQEILDICKGYYDEYVIEE